MMADRAISIARANSTRVRLNLSATPFDECAYGAGFRKRIPFCFNQLRSSALVSSFIYLNFFRRDFELCLDGGTPLFSENLLI